MPTPRKHPSNAQRQSAYRERQRATRIAGLRAKNLPPAAPIPTMPSNARWSALTRMAQDLLKAARKEMESYRDERSEAWQESQRAEALQETIDRIDEALDCLAETA